MLPAMFRVKGGHLGFRTERFKLILKLSPRCFLPSFESVGLSVKEKKRNLDVGFQTGAVLSTFDLQVTLMLPTKIRVNWPFGSGELVKNRFSRLPPWWPSWNLRRDDFSYFLSTCQPDTIYQVSSQLDQVCRRSGFWKQIVDDARRTTHIDRS